MRYKIKQESVIRVLISTAKLRKKIKWPPEINRVAIFQTKQEFTERDHGIPATCEVSVSRFQFHSAWGWCSLSSLK
jgi:hypothetical protein